MKSFQQMKIPAGILLLLFFSQTVIAQTSSRRLLGSFIVKKIAYNYEFAMQAQDSYTFNISSITDNDKEDSTDEGEQPDDSTASSAYPFNEFTKDIFQAIFMEQMKTKYNLSDSATRDAASEVFFKIKARLDFIDDEPVTAYFIMKKDFIWSFLRSNSSSYYQGALGRLIAYHYIHRVEVETEDGAIKNISVYLIMPESAKDQTSSPRKFLLFKNQFPVSISGKFDYEKFSNVNLFCFNCSGIDGLTRYIRLSDLAIIDIVYENDKEDYSPSNRTFSVTPSHPIAELKKEKRSKIVELSAFTDFVGLDRNEPNGLIQIEAKRKININTKSRLFARGKKTMEILQSENLGKLKVESKPQKRGKAVYYKVYSPTDETIKPFEIRIPKDRFRSVYFSLLSYIEPFLLFSKLEQNNRFIDSTKGASGILDPVSLYQYQLASFGLKLQLFRISFPQIKIQWNTINAGAFWSRTRVALTSDSAGPSVALNSNFWQFGSNVVFRPDNRWGASLGLEYMVPRIWKDEYTLSSLKGIFQNQFDVWLRTGDDGKLFFRYRWTYQNKNHNNNFTQIQLGYSLNLFSGSSASEDDNK